MSADPLAVPRPPARRGLWVTLGVLLVTMVGSAYYGWRRWQSWQEDWARLGPLEPSGGVYQEPRLELKVPSFRQADERWGAQHLADTPASLAAEGCAVSSAAMVLASYGFDTDPGKLNEFLQASDGYEGAGWIRWEKAAEITNGQYEKAYEGDPSYQLIDLNLRAGNPVIVRLHREGGTHFVVIAGKDGYDYLTRDPGAGAAKGLYPLREYGSKIEKLRYYRRVK